MQTTPDHSEKNVVTPGGAFSERLKQVRAKRGWSQQRLAERLREVGSPMSRETIAKIEAGGKRAEKITLAEVLAVSFALGVPPAEMMVPHGMESRLRIVGDRPASVPGIARAWIAGDTPLSDEDPSDYYLEKPREELEPLADVIRAIANGEEPSEVAVTLAFASWADPTPFFKLLEMIQRGEVLPDALSETHRKLEQIRRRQFTTTRSRSDERGEEA